MSGAVGGAERVLAELASRLAAEGNDISLLSFDAGGDSFYPLDPAIRRIFLPIGDAGRPATLPETLRRAAALRQTARREAPDIAIGFMHSMFIPLALALAGTGIPVIGSEHTSPDTYRARRGHRLLLRAALPALTAVTVPTDAIRDFYPDGARGKITVLPNPVTISTGAARRDGEIKTILAVGRLQPVKDHATLIDAFSRLAPQHPGWRLRIVGDGPLRAPLEAQIAAYGLQERIALPGILADLAGEYGAADIFAMPSLNESFGLSLAEALASGLPGIGFFDCIGCRELIQNDHNGVLVGAGDRSWRLAEGLGRLMRDDDLRARLGRNAPQTVRRYDLPVIAAQWMELLRRVAGQRAQA